MIILYKFIKDSGIVKVWVTLIMGGTYTFEQVPKLFNLRECVQEVLIEMGLMSVE